MYMENFSYLIKLYLHGQIIIEMDFDRNLWINNCDFNKTNKNKEIFLVNVTYDNIYCIVLIFCCITSTK